MRMKEKERRVEREKPRESKKEKEL